MIVTAEATEQAGGDIGQNAGGRLYLIFGMDSIVYNVMVNSILVFLCSQDLYLRLMVPRHCALTCQYQYIPIKTRKSNLKRIVDYSFNYNLIKYMILIFYFILCFFDNAFYGEIKRTLIRLTYIFTNNSGNVENYDIILDHAITNNIIKQNIYISDHSDKRFVQISKFCSYSNKKQNS